MKNKYNKEWIVKYKKLVLRDFEKETYMDFDSKKQVSNSNFDKGKQKNNYEIKM